MIDLLVAGGGPIGLATAIEGRLAGMEVVIVEPRESLIDKACGEGLMPEAVHLLHLLGVEPSGIDFFGIRYLSGDRSIDARFTEGHGMGVRRTQLYEAMYQRAFELGVQWRKDKVCDVQQTSQWVEAAGLRSRYLVAADGLHSTVRTSLGLHANSTNARRYGVRQHFRVAPWSDLVEVHWLPHAELYVTPVSEEIVGIAVLGERLLDLPAAIKALPVIAGKLSGAQVASEAMGAGPLRQKTSARTKGRTLLVGDASGYVDALTGEGLRIGLSQAHAAVTAVINNDLNSYEREWFKITRSYRMLTSALLWASSHPPLRRLIVPSACAMPWAFQKIVDSLAA
jgi:flavin-dependent dehydrogenase